MKWNLRLAAASRGIWKASELHKMLADRGMVISAGKMSGLWSGRPMTRPRGAAGAHRASPSSRMAARSCPAIQASSTWVAWTCT